MSTLFAAGQIVTASMLNQIYSHADTNDTIVNTTGQTQLTSSYTIPANEPTTDSAYEIDFGGTGVQGSTQQQLQFSVWLQGNSLFQNVAIAAAAFAINAQFRFEGQARIVCASTGATGAFRAGVSINFTQTANPAGQFTAATQSIPLADGNSTGVTIDTTSAMLFVVKCGWTGVVGAPTITNRRTIFRKVS